MPMTGLPPRRVDDVAGWDGQDELVEVLHQGSGTTIERIVSQGHTTDWCDQDHDEWVLVHEGAAQLEVAGRGTVDLVAGQYLLLPARCRHRVVWTEQFTVWLAVHLPPTDPVSD